MTPEHDKQLCERYPLIFKNRSGDMRSTAMCWGFETGDGWFTIIDAACALIYWPLEQARTQYERLRKEEGTEDWAGDVICAVDVERARLAMTAAEQSIPVAVQVKEKFGTLRFYVDGGTEKADAYIEFAEYLSGHTCEECGAPGERRGGGWIRTLCDTHEAAREAAYAARLKTT